MSKKCWTTGFPISLQCLAQSSRIHFAIEVCLSLMNDLMIIPVPRRKVKAFWKARNNMPELLPAWFAWMSWTEMKQFSVKQKRKRQLLAFSAYLEDPSVQQSRNFFCYFTFFEKNSYIYWCLAPENIHTSSRVFFLKTFPLPGISSFASYFSLKVLAFQTPCSPHQSCQWRYLLQIWIFLEPHSVLLISV